MSNWVKRYRGKHVIAACILSYVAVTSCLDDRSTGPAGRLSPSGSPHESTALAPCIITANVDPGFPITDVPTSGGGCGISWRLFVPPLNTTYNVKGFYWSREGDPIFPTTPMKLFDTCCTGAGDLQNGSLLVDFSPAVRSATVRTWDYSLYQLGAPAGLTIKAVNAQGDTVARATTDGTNPPTLLGTGIVRLVIDPIPTGQFNQYGDQRVIPVRYQIEFMPACPPTGDPNLDNPDILEEFRNRLAAAHPEAAPGSGGQKEQGGTGHRLSDGSTKTIPWNDPNATECSYDPIGAYTNTKPLTGDPNAVPIFTYHTHQQGNNKPVYACPATPGAPVPGPGDPAQTPGDGRWVPTAYPDQPESGGGSPEDWRVARDFGIKSYIITGTGRIYVLDPEIAKGQEKNNPNRYQFPDARGCAVKMAPDSWK